MKLTEIIEDWDDIKLIVNEVKETLDNKLYKTIAKGLLQEQLELLTAMKD